MNRGAVLLQAPPWNPLAPPLGIAFLSTYLRHHGWEARALDLSLLLRDMLRNSHDRADLWLPSRHLCWCRPFYDSHVRPLVAPLLPRLAAQVLETRPAIVGISCTSASRDFAEDLARELRSLCPELVLIAGGPGLFGRAQQGRFSRDVFDFLVEGDGEKPLHALLEAGNAGVEVPRLPGLIPWRGAASRPTLPLDQSPWSLPHPRLDEFDLDHYDHQAVPLLLSRGCIRRCAFCSDSRVWPRHQSSPTGIVIDAMRQHASNGRSRFQFRDLVINGDLRVLEELADGILGAGLQVRWSALATVRPDMSPALLAKLQRSGLVGLAFGIESFSTPVLRAMGKGYDAVGAIDCLRRVRDAGIAPTFMSIVGFPGETDQDFETTLNTLECNPDIAAMADFLNVCARAPGSLLWDEPERFKITQTAPFPSITWSCGDNTYARRLERLTTLATMLQSKGLGLIACDSLAQVGLPGFGTGARELADDLFGDESMRADFDIAFASVGPSYALAVSDGSDSQGYRKDVDMVEQVLRSLARAEASPMKGWNLVAFTPLMESDGWRVSAELLNQTRTMRLSVRKSGAELVLDHTWAEGETDPLSAAQVARLRHLISHYLRWTGSR